MFYRSLAELIDSLRREHVTKETFHFYVRRDNVIGDALKRTLKPSFSPNKEVMVGVQVLIVFQL